MPLRCLSDRDSRIAIRQGLHAVWLFPAPAGPWVCGDGVGVDQNGRANLDNIPPCQKVTTIMNCIGSRSGLSSHLPLYCGLWCFRKDLTAHRPFCHRNPTADLPPPESSKRPQIGLAPTLPQNFRVWHCRVKNHGVQCVDSMWDLAELVIWMNDSLSTDGPDNSGCSYEPQVSSLTRSRSPSRQVRRCQFGVRRRVLFEGFASQTGRHAGSNMQECHGFLMLHGHFPNCLLTSKV
jgi:hypothetical protein